MRRILRYTQMAVVLAVLSSSIQGCYTYIPAMSRESDGIYYTASKDADRAERAATTPNRMPITTTDTTTSLITKTNTMTMAALRIT